MNAELEIPNFEDLRQGSGFAKLKTILLLPFFVALIGLGWQTENWFAISAVAFVNVVAHLLPFFVAQTQVKPGNQHQFISRAAQIETAIQVAANAVLIALLPANSLVWLASLICIWRAPFMYRSKEAWINSTVECLTCVGLMVVVGYDFALVAGYLLLAATAFAVSFRMMAFVRSLYERIYADATEMKRISEEKAKLAMEAREFRRLASMGQLAAGIAHEINNPLTYVISNLEYAARMIDSKDEMSRDVLSALDDAAQGAERVRYIVRDVKSFSRSDEQNVKQEVDLNEVVSSSLNIMKSQVRQNAVIETKFGKIPAIAADKAALGQVFVNLLANAAQAIDPKGTGENKISILTTYSNNVVHVDVTDTGSGIEEQIMDKIFEPFFTSKPLGIGTGLGLSIVKQIVESNNGEISVKSKPGEGTTFRVSFPAVDFSEENSVTGSYAGNVRNFPKLDRILIVDDDVSVLAGLARQFYKCKVVTASSGVEGLSILKNDNAFDAILCDLIMPMMGGVEFYENLLQLNPDLQNKVVFMTGGAFTPQVQAFLEQEWIRCLGKPFTWSDLLRALMLPGTPDEIRYFEELSTRPPRESSRF